MKAQRRYKRQQLDESKNEKSAEFCENDDRYIPLPTLSTLNKSNRPFNLDEIRSLIYLVSITKTKKYQTSPDIA